MKTFFRQMLRLRTLVILFFAALAAVGALASQQVQVNTDLADYLPEESASTVDLALMEDIFGNDITNAELMVKDITFTEAKKLYEKIQDVEGVKDVSWVLGASLGIPEQMYPESMLAGKYEDGCALYSLTLDENYGIELAEEIRALTDHETAMDGSFINGKTVAAVSGPEITKVVTVVVIFGLFVLMLTLDTWLEPVLLLICLMAAVVMNGGSNLIFGTISNVTKTAASVLQMGVSVDYFIFILHRYKENRRKNSGEHGGEESVEAMAVTLEQSLVSVLSSSLTTVAGFLALLFMRYRIGMDLGLVLAKGVAISLICAFTLLPCMVLTFEKWSDRTSHRRILSGVGPLPKAFWKLRIPMAILFLVCMLPSFVLQYKNTFYYGTSHSYKETHDVMLERQEIQDVFGRSNTMVIMVPEGDYRTEEVMVEELESWEEVRSVTSYASLVGYQIPSMMIPDSISSQLIGGGYSRIVLRVDLEEESQETFDFIDRLEETVQSYYPEDTHLVGNSVSTYDLKKVISADSIKVNLIAVAAIFLILLFSFRTLRIPVILTLGIEGAIWINMAIPYMMGTPLFYIGYLVVSSILLGATVDYAILLTSRFREYREHMEYKEAMLASLKHSCISIFTSSSILIVAGILLWQVSTNQLVAQLGFLMSRGSFLAVVMVVMTLPAYLKLTDH